jgi:SAM-dependent methyltransferase
MATNRNVRSSSSRLGKLFTCLEGQISCTQASRLCAFDHSFLRPVPNALRIQRNVRTSPSRPLQRRSRIFANAATDYIVSRRVVLRLVALLPLACRVNADARGVPPGSLPRVFTDFAETWPFFESDFERADDAPDAYFYSEPKAEHHIDDDAIFALRGFLASIVERSRRSRSVPSQDISPVQDVLDLCSSFESYLPLEWSGRRRVAGLGMNMDEMRKNPALTEAVVVDLNKRVPDECNLFPYGDNEFDLVVCALSIDYLTQPLQVMREIGRVLRPGGMVAIAFSDRVFQSKAVAMWTGTGDLDHVWIVANYMHFSSCFEDEIQIYDLSPRKAGQSSDPLYVVQAVRRSANPSFNRK